MVAPQMIAAVAFGWLGYRLLHSKKRKKTSSVHRQPPTLDCGLYPWRPKGVDSAIDEALAVGERDLERLALQAAREVYPTTPEGRTQPWPPSDGDARAECILDRILIRVNRRLAELADDQAGDDQGPGGLDPGRPLPDEPPTDPAPPGHPKPTPPVPDPPGPHEEPTLEPPARPDEPPPLEGPPDPEDPGEWPEYPEPGPVDLTKWTDPGNYPTPEHFHQIGGPNSGTTLKTIAIKALTTAFYLVHDDLELAKELAERDENWRAYRDAINCCPWNHALYGSDNQPGTPYYYDTPHGDHISLYPVHDDVVWSLVSGEPPQRRVSEHDPKHPAGGRHAFIWLPPLDQAELLEGRVKVERAHWWTGDFTMMPPPEVLSLGVTDVPPGRVWGCGGFETSFDYAEGE